MEHLHILRCSASLFQLPPLLVTLTELFPFCILYKSTRHHSHNIAYLCHCYNPVSEFWILSSLIQAWCILKLELPDSVLSSHHGHCDINSAFSYLIKLHFWALPHFPLPLLSSSSETAQRPYYSHPSKSAPLIFPLIQSAFLSVR